VIIDTNVVSEVMRGDPTGVIGTWLELPRDTGLTVAAVTVQEISYGLSRLPTGRRRDDMVRLWDELRDGLAFQVLGLDSGTALLAGELMADRERHGRSLGVPDAQIAATCLVHRTALATRNVRDFTGLGIDIVNPWG
jgi:toxin FitB